MMAVTSALPPVSRAYAAIVPTPPVPTINTLALLCAMADSLFQGQWVGEVVQFEV